MEKNAPKLTKLDKRLKITNSISGTSIDKVMETYKDPAVTEKRQI